MTSSIATAVYYYCYYYYFYIDEIIMFQIHLIIFCSSVIDISYLNYHHIIIIN